MRLIVWVLMVVAVSLASVSITFATGDVPNSLTGVFFYGDIGYGLPLPWKYYALLEIQCNVQQSCQIAPSYSPLFFALDMIFYMVIGYSPLLFLYTKSRTAAPPALKS